MKKQKRILIAKAQARYIRISPRKARKVIDLIRGEKVPAALAILAQLNKRAKIAVEKLLNSAISNAKQNPAINPNELVIAKITADGGPMMKRYRAAAMGRATMIRHRTSHLLVELVGEEIKQIKTEKKKVKTAKAKK